jgi:alkylation response protein AidB-like acyl-CoA dehydrogenase
MMNPPLPGPPPVTTATSAEPAIPARNPEQDQFAASLHDVLGARGPDAARHWAAGDHSPGLALWHVSAAKVACADAAHRAARAALQVHGAIGYTQELDLGLWLTKVRALLPAWGTQAEHRALVLEALTADGESAWS